MYLLVSGFRAFSRVKAGGLELDLEWRDVSAAAAVQQPAAAWAAGSAVVWRLHALAPQQPAARSIFSLQVCSVCAARWQARPACRRAWGFAASPDRLPVPQPLANI